MLITLSVFGQSVGEGSCVVEIEEDDVVTEDEAVEEADGERETVEVADGLTMEEVDLDTAVLAVETEVEAVKMDVVSMNVDEAADEIDIVSISVVWEVVTISDAVEISEDVIISEVVTNILVIMTVSDVAVTISEAVEVAVAEGAVKVSEVVTVSVSEAIVDTENDGAILEVDTTVDAVVEDEGG